MHSSATVRTFSITFLFVLCLSMPALGQLNITSDSVEGFGPADFHRLEAEAKGRAWLDRSVFDAFRETTDLVCTQTNYDVRFHDIYIRVDDNTETLHGCVKFVAAATEPSVNQVQVDLTYNMTVDSIVSPAGSLTYTRDGDVVVVTADEIIDIGPEAGEHGGGVPGDTADVPGSGHQAWLCG